VTIDNERPSPTVHWLAVHYGDRLASENHPRRRCPPCGIEYSDCFDVALPCGIECSDCFPAALPFIPQGQYFIPQGPPQLHACTELVEVKAALITSTALRQAQDKAQCKHAGDGEAPAGVRATPGPHWPALWNRPPLQSLSWI